MREMIDESHQESPNGLTYKMHYNAMGFSNGHNV